MTFRSMKQCALLALFLTKLANAFTPTYRGSSLQQNSVVSCRSLLHLNDCSDSPEDLEKESNEVPLEREKSKMLDYVSQYLEKERNRDLPGDDEPNTSSPPFLPGYASHLVAIPMDGCHELLLELESVQRAILYHCPILTDACIPGAATKLPLLYINAPKENSAYATRVLSKLTNEMVQKHIYREQDEFEGEEDPELLNADGYRPLTMTFQSLEVDGANNNVLNTVGVTRDYGSTKLLALVKELKTAVETQGWQAVYPTDPHGESFVTACEFRPRVPFMELPSEFDENLSIFKDKATEIKEEDFKFLTSSEGGNGISPIFWCQWWDDVFGRNIRLRKIGIYPRNLLDSPIASNVRQSTFYLPFETIALPDGSSAMLKAEKELRTYQDKRFEDEQREMSNAIDTDAKGFDKDENEDNNLLMMKTYDRLERLYISSTGTESGTMEVEDFEGKGGDGANGQSVKTEMDDEDEPLLGELSFGIQQKASQGDHVDDWMKARIKMAIAAQESEKARNSVQKEMPPIESNPIFKAYKEGTLVAKEETKKSPEKDMGPYPSRGHFVGVWRVVSSPTGFPAEETTSESSENLVLRIDGTTAGGPTLDQKARQKASGGTWKVLEGDDGEVILRIRLLIPPKKDRVIEMVGQVNRLGVGSGIPLASKAFGVPYLEEMAKRASGETHDIMTCVGDVFIEDVVTRKNREQIGEFWLTKIQGPKNPGEYTITVPQSK